MDPSKVFCHNPDCPARGKVDCGNIAPSPDASTGLERETAIRLLDARPRLILDVIALLLTFSHFLESVA